VDPPHDGNNLSFDRGDGKTDRNDDNTVVIANPRDSRPPASLDPLQQPPAIQQWLQEIQEFVLDNYPMAGPIPPGMHQILEVSATTHMLLANSRDHNMAAHNDAEKSLYQIEERLIALKMDQHRLFDAVNSKIDNLLQMMDAAWTENTALHEACHASREETAALKVAVDTLTKKLDENITITVPPSPDTATCSTAMEEMTMQLSHIKHDIQDVLDTVRNPPGKRKRCTSDQDNELTMPTNGRLATQ
jgi:regulator of replication initiation timing